MNENVIEEVEQKHLRKTRVGFVVSNKMSKTVVVGVTTKKRHAQYGKFVARTKKYYAHDENNECSIGDRVEITETRPLSKLKRWNVRKIVEKAA